MKTLQFKLFLLYCIHIVECQRPQETLHPEINDQFEEVTTTINSTTNIKNPENLTQSQEISEILDEDLELTTTTLTTNDTDLKENLINSVYKVIKLSIIKLISAPKVYTVLRNIGTCIVNGMMEIVSYYFPAPFIPLIASAAGMVIPFEPVVMLRRRMPVTSYRRAIKTAVNSFLNTFDGYKFNEYDEDPYMTRRFNRRFMNEISKEETNKKDDS